MERNPKEVLVLQVGEGVTSFCAVARTTTKLRQNVDFTTFGTASYIEDEVFENKPQMLITGVISLDRVDNGEVERLVTMLREKNPQLVVVTYSSLSIPGSCFDLQITKNFEIGGFLRVSHAIERFRNGSLRRPQPQSITP